MDVAAYRIMLVICIAVLLAGLATGMWLLWRARPRRFARRMLAALFAVELVLGLLHQLKYVVGLNPPLVYQLHMNSEFTLTPLLSAAQFVMAGVTATLLARWLKPATRLERLFWVWLALVLLFFGVDEYFQLHENFPMWELWYVAASVPLAALGLRVWSRAYRGEVLAGGLFVTAAGTMVMSALVVESVISRARLLRGQLVIFEEMFEMVGVTFLLGAMLIIAQGRLQERDWSRLTRILPLAGLTTVLLFGGRTWLMPTLELRLTAETQRVTWMGGDLELRGARVDGSPARPGDTFSVWLYWRVKGPIWNEPHVSLHVLERPDLAISIASAEEYKIGEYAITGFFPGLTVRKEIELQLPENIATPASLAVMARLWGGDHRRGDVRGIDIASSERQVLGSDQVLIGSIVLPGDAPDDTPGTASDARFGAALALRGYTLPGSARAGESLELALDWQVLDAPGADHTQFVHLFSVADGSFALGHDEAPFRGRLPGRDWPEGHRLRDLWRVPLPAELAAGTYRLVYGLYDSGTRERMTLRANGNGMADGLLPLGSVQVLPAAERDSEGGD